MKFKAGFQILVLWLCLLGLVRASCTSYGHSCWGAHGKRSNAQTRRSENEWKLLKLAPENTDQLKSDVNSQMEIGNFLNTLKTQDEKMVGPPTLTSDESQNNIGRKFPKKKYRLKLFNKAPTDTSSNEDFSLDSPNWNVAVRDDYKVPDYRLLKMLRRDIFD